MREAVPEEEGLFGKRPVIGSVEKNSAMLSMRASSNNASHPVLRVRWEPAGTGALLHCWLGMGPIGIGYLVFFIGLAGATLLFVAYKALFGRIASVDLWGLFIGIPAIAIVWVGMAMLGRFAAREDDDRLIAFVGQTLDATATT
jgi:hypothetical protein